jgi:tRNA (guanine6-N2)-methyltransferase
VTVEIVGRVGRGLEWVAADEVAAVPGATDLRLAAREVTARLDELSAAVAGLRAVDDVFVRVGAVDGVGRSPASLAATARAVAGLDVAGAARLLVDTRPVPARPVVDVVVSLDGDRRYSRYDLEDAAGPLLADVLGGAHHSRRHGRPPPPDLAVRVAVSGGRAEVLVRVAARPLHRRPWKMATGPGTLHPPVAAALLRLAGPAGLVVDPCCGDGTIPVEAAVDPGRRPLGPGPVAIGCDLAPDRVVNALANARSAGAARRVLLSVADGARLPMRDASAEARRGVPGVAVVTNPPWELAVTARGGLRHGLTPLWDEAARLLGDAGSLATVVDAGLDAPAGLARAGWSVALAERVRLAGRLCDVIVARTGGGGQPLSPTLRAWRARAVGL